MEIAILLVILLIVGAIFSFFFFRSRAPGVQFALTSLETKPNSAVELKITYLNSWGSEPNPTKPLVIINERSENIFKPGKQLIADCGIDSKISHYNLSDNDLVKLRSCLEDQSGFSDGYVLDFQNKSSFIPLPSPSCNDSSSGIGNPDWKKPPRRVDDSERIVVLAATTPGSYTIKIPENWLCNSDELPNQAQEFSLVVK